MNFSFAAAWFWALLALPIIVFYLLKVRLRRVPVSTVMFWEQVIEEQQARSLWQQLRHWISLLMQLLLLALLVLALADPYFFWEVRQQRRVVLVVDNSASMQATDVRPTRLGRAKEMSHVVINRLRFRDEMAIITAGTQPRVVCGLTSHQRNLRAAIDGIIPSDGPTRVIEALELGRRLLASHPNGELVVLSDGGFETIAGRPALTDAQTNWIPLGTATKNVAITRFQVRRSLLDPLGYQVLVEVRNLSPDPVESRLELDLAENLVDVWPLKLAAGERWTRHIEQTSAVGGLLTARIRHEDPLPLDNVARAILPSRRRQPVVLVTSGNRFLQGVFTANPLVDLAVTPTPPSATKPGVVTVFHKTMPEQWPAGDVVVLQPESASPFWEVVGRLEHPLVAKQDRESALMANVHLDNVLLPEALKLKPTGTPTILASSEAGDPLYFAVTHPQGRVLVLTVNLDQGDLPLRTAFPILFSNALAWFEGSGGELRDAIAAGAQQQIRLPRDFQNSRSSSLARIELESPAGEKSLLPVIDHTVTIGPLETCGVWSIRLPPTETAPAAASISDVPETAVLSVACNLTDPQESDLRDRGHKPVAQPLATAGLTHPLWFYLTLLAWALMGGEWWMYQRRKIA